MDLDLKGRHAILTGPAKGMGAAITRAFAAEGTHLALLARDVNAVTPIAREAESMGVDVQVVPCDVTDPGSARAAVDEVARVWDGQIDILVNIAGGTGPVGTSGVKTTEAEFDEIVALNQRGPFTMIRAVAPWMQARKSGKIVNIGGTFGMRGRAGRLAYSSSKWGLRGLTKSFAIELGPDNINVNTVAPGMVDGPRFREKVVPTVAAQHGLSEDEAVARHAADYALGRISTDDDVASAVLFMASDRARQITGVDLPVDGGWAAL